MKKFLATILALIYLSTAVGKVHLPGSFNKMLSWILKSCTYCGTDKSSGNTDGQESQLCCDAGQKQVKHTDHNLTETALHPKRVCTEVVVPAFPGYSFEYFPSLSRAYSLINAPPRTATVSLYILHRIFRL